MAILETKKKQNDPFTYDPENPVPSLPRAAENALVIVGVKDRLHLLRYVAMRHVPD